MKCQQEAEREIAWVPADSQSTLPLPQHLTRLDYVCVLMYTYSKQSGPGINQTQATNPYFRHCLLYILRFALLLPLAQLCCLHFWTKLIVSLRGSSSVKAAIWRDCSAEIKLLEVAIENQILLPSLKAIELFCIQKIRTC